jgi:antitoxin VapB
MAFQIKDPETIRLIRTLAQRAGQGDERVVDTAVREQLARLRTPEEEEERRARVYAIVEELQASFKASGLPLVDHGELLYDENGLPREGELTEYELRYYFPERYAPTDGDGEE